MTKQHTTPCSTCPFRRTISPGELGGSPTQTYVGQIEAGFVIPCHDCIDYDDPSWKAKASKPGGVSQCAGAAIFRSNVGKTKPNHPVLLELPGDADNVFASYEQFVSHHDQVKLPEGFLTQWHIDLCVQRELERAGVVVTLVPKGEVKT